MERRYFVYIISNRLVTRLYVGVTNDLIRRVYQHKALVNKRFTNRYNLSTLVYFQNTEDLNSALHQKTKLESWSRQTKLDLIKAINPGLVDLAEGWYDNFTSLESDWIAIGDIWSHKSKL